MVLSKLQKKQHILLRPARAGFDLEETKLSLKEARKRARQLVNGTTTIVIAKPVDVIKKVKEVV